MNGLQSKTIKKVLQSKLDSWLSTITDQNLVHKIRHEVIVTGGSIASMLLGESPKDFDIYFQTIETTEAVANYYVNKLKETHPLLDVLVKIEDRQNIKGETETRVINYIKSAGILSISEDPNSDELDDTAKDILTDISSITNGVKIEQDSLINADAPYRPVFISENAITLSHKMQIVTRFYGEPDKIHDNFDYIHACNWYRYHDNHLELKVEALEALMAKRLVYRGSLYPLASLFRMRKFMERGYKISAGQILKISLQISSIDLTDIAVLREQLIGVDMAYFNMLLVALERAKNQADADAAEFNIDAAYISTIVDKIFN